MEYIYYNTAIEAFISFKNYKRYDLDLGEWIELIRVDTIKPNILPTQKASSEWVLDLNAKTYTKVWTVVDKSQYEIAMEDWNYSYQFRIVCPIAFAEQYPGLYAHFQVQKLPIEDHPSNPELVRVYINTILDRHSVLLQELQDVIDIELIPTQL